MELAIFNTTLEARVAARLAERKLLVDRPLLADTIAAGWQRALAGQEYVEIGALGDPSRAQRSFEMQFSALRDPDGRQIGACQFAYDTSPRGSRGRSGCASRRKRCARRRRWKRSAS